MADGAPRPRGVAGPRRAGHEPAERLRTLRSTDGTLLAVTDVGDGPPALLLHGYGASSAVNWERPGVLRALVEGGRRAVSVDLRGHGRSGAPQRPSGYALERIAEDLAVVLDELLAADRSVDLIGYSLGARIALELAPGERRLRSLVLGGVGARTLAGPQETEELAEAMEAPRLASVRGRRARAFRGFAEATGADLRALAAWQRALGGWPAPEPGLVRLPALVLVGDSDDLAGSPEPLAARLPAGRCATVSGNHMNAMLDPAFSSAIVSFLRELDCREPAR